MSFQTDASVSFLAIDGSEFLLHPSLPACLLAGRVIAAGNWDVRPSAFVVGPRPFPSQFCGPRKLVGYGS